MPINIQWQDGRAVQGDRLRCTLTATLQVPVLHLKAWVRIPLLSILFAQFQHLSMRPAKFCFYIRCIPTSLFCSSVTSTIGWLFRNLSCMYHVHAYPECPYFISSARVISN
ncbi:hypothetical protein P168DRAFT_114366 [Aspergillus campestris IBT 28561]|uniref:Uncharacterized protein n=1 Tax=Aspergillus campestris (strain IBT 28561) TaxID=1392248 RepID=A0A2I1D9L1_ASPC2|nr:uncharacterized protein P168DRAFT_114366 [Aspergillus campestris IBT 28561]PKY06573.1 hypothetical protein P168DRAFT_114366 [Aspergillus campestris IBT 28561]